MLVLIMTGFVVLALRAYDLQVLRGDFLTLQGDARQQRVINVPAHRGMIVDRHGEPLAVSTPVDSIWVDPSRFVMDKKALRALAGKLNMSSGVLQRKILRDDTREFVYLKRQLPPAVAQDVITAGLSGVFLQREYKRYYPTAEVTAHLLGFTDIDDQGQEGVELAYNDWLAGGAGRKRVIQDRLGRVVEDLESIEPARPGQDLKLSIDKRLQYLTYRELKSVVQRHKAVSGSAVMLDSYSGEILAIANQPAFNPHKREDLRGEKYRNRAVTDVFEPGSTVKPFTIAAALENRYIKRGSKIDTSPGFVKVGSYTIKDNRNHGVLSIESIISLSSNVGATRLSLGMPASALWHVYNRFGFGRTTGSGFPGESTGYLNHFDRWSKVEQATLSYGYGLATTALQLAQAYSVIANGGYSHPLTYIARQSPPESVRVISDATAEAMRKMLISVVDEGGTGRKAHVPGYRMAGKTGTVRKSTAHGYSEEEYISLFAGLGPVNDPRLVVVVVIDQPGGDEYYGGQVAAPVFSAIMEDALRILNIAPDDPRSLYARNREPGSASGDRI